MPARRFSYPQSNKDKVCWVLNVLKYENEALEKEQERLKEMVEKEALKSFLLCSALDRQKKKVKKAKDKLSQIADVLGRSLNNDI